MRTLAPDTHTDTRFYCIFESLCFDLHAHCTLRMYLLLLTSLLGAPLSIVHCSLFSLSLVNLPFEISDSNCFLKSALLCIAHKRADTNGRKLCASALFIEYPLAV